MVQQGKWTVKTVSAWAVGIRRQVLQSPVHCLPVPSTCPEEVGKLACVQPPGLRSGVPHALFLGPSVHSLFRGWHPPQKGGTLKARAHDTWH